VARWIQNFAEQGGMDMWFDKNKLLGATDALAGATGR